MHRYLSLLVIFLILWGSFSAMGQKYSTLQGGPWTAPSTWQDGVVPGSSDDVVLVGPVQLDKAMDYYVHSLTIDQGGKLQQAVYSYYYSVKVHITTDLWNKGTIEGFDDKEPYFYVGRDVFNEGNWTKGQVFFDDSLSHILRALPGSIFSPGYIHADSATIVSDRDCELTGLNTTNVYAKKLVLQKDFLNRPTTFRFTHGTFLRIAEIEGNGNAIAGDSSSVLTSGTIAGQSVAPVLSHIHMKGTVNLLSSCIVNDSLVIDDTLKIADKNFYYSIELTVNGPVRNNGYVLPSVFGDRFHFHVSGNIENFGDWNAYLLELTSNGTQYLATDLNHIFQNQYFNAEEEEVISRSSLRFDKTTAKIKHVTLQANHSLYLSNSTNFSVETLQGNGNHISFQSNSFFGNQLGTPVIDNVVLEGEAKLNISGTFRFTGNLIVNGSFLPAGNGYWDPVVIVQDKMVNYGQILWNGGTKIYFQIEGDMENAGSWESGTVTATGHKDQYLAFRDSSSFQPYLELKTDRLGNSYQWFWGDSLLTNTYPYSNVNNSNLRIRAVTPSEFGVYQCRVDSSGDTLFSRKIYLWNGVTGIRPGDKNVLSQTPATFELLPNFPNPFNSVTYIRYGLSRAEEVHVYVFDPLGRRIKAWRFSRQSPGLHTLKFDASDLSSGIYFYQIRAGSHRQVKKMILMK